MERWVAGWAHPHMYAGIAGRGASDAWYLSAMIVELAKLERNPIVGGALDLYKCFDQIVRQLLYVILALAGCPHQVLVPYNAYQEHCVVLNFFAGGSWRATQTPMRHTVRMPIEHVFHCPSDSAMDPADGKYGSHGVRSCR